MTEFVRARAELRRLAEDACRQAKKPGGCCAVLAGQGLVTAAAAPSSNHPDSPGPVEAMSLSAPGLGAPPAAPRQPSADLGSL